jgi:hypothetical protein
LECGGPAAAFEISVNPTNNLFSYKFTFRNRNAFPITETELRLIAALAIIGESSQPKKGYRTPAASGIPSVL